MTAGGGDDDRPFGHLLAADIGEIDLVVGQFTEEIVQPRGGWFDFDFAGQEANRLGEALHGDDLDPFDDGRFRRAFGRHDQPAEGLALRGGNRHRQGAFGGPRGAVEGQLAHDRILGSSSEATCPLPMSVPRAIGRSNEAASLGRSAGARLRL